MKDFPELRTPALDEIISLNEHKGNYVVINKAVNGVIKTIHGRLIWADKHSVKTRPDENDPNTYNNSPFNPGPAYYDGPKSTGIFTIAVEDSVVYDCKNS